MNHRIIHGETVETVRERVRDILADDRIQIRAVSVENDPSPISDPDSPAFGLIERTIHQVIPGDLLVSPYLVMGGTDAKYYADKSPNVYRFLPLRLGSEGLGRVHGTDERVTFEDLSLSVRFFAQLILNSEAL